MLAFDTETTGVDLYHGCEPFFFAFCDEAGKLSWVEWDVDPFTRKPQKIHSDQDDIYEVLSSDELIGHNVNFDLRSAEIAIPEIEWIWSNIHDTLIMSHIFRNLWGHSLKHLREILLFIGPGKQDRLREATNKARAITRRKDFQAAHGKWRTAAEADPHWPAIKRAPSEKQEDVEGWWMFDTWLPRMIAKLAPEFLPEENHEQSTRSNQTNRERSQGDRERSLNPTGRSDNRKRTSNPRLHQTTQTHTQKGCRNSQTRRDHSWFTVLRDYALEDVESTIGSYWIFRKYLAEEGLADQYKERHRLLEITHEMQSIGVTLRDNLGSEIKRYKTESDKHREAADKLTKGFYLKESKVKKSKTSPKHSSLQNRPLKNQPPKFSKEELNLNSAHQLRQILYQDYKLPVTARTPTNLPSTKAEDLAKLQETCSIKLDNGMFQTTISRCPDQEKAGKFISHLLLSRRNEKSVGYLESYREWSTSNGRDTRILEGSGEKIGEATEPVQKKSRNSLHLHQTSGSTSRQGMSLVQKSRLDSRASTRILHANYNITGTKFTRQSSNNPNLTNIGTGKEETYDNPDSPEMDYQLREVFGPRSGRVWVARDYSNIELRIWAYDCGNKELISAFEHNISIHLLIFRELWPRFKDLTDDEAKDRPEYKWTKNGDFAILYGGSPRRVDATYKVSGGYDRIASRFPEVRTYTQSLHDQVFKRGWVQTLTGYRLYIPKSEPHKAVSGRVQGTAGSVIGRAMIDCHDYLKNSNTSLNPNTYNPAHLIIQVHDELVFDLDKRDVSIHNPRLQELMEQQGEHIGIPLLTGGKLITEHWAGGEVI